MNSRTILIILLGCFALVCPTKGMTGGEGGYHALNVDSIIRKYINYNASYDSLTAEVYLRGSMQIRKHNIFLKLIRHFVPVGKKPDNGSFESVGKVMRFSSYYYYVPEAFNGDFNLYAQQMPEYLFVNAYASRFTAYEFVAPLSSDAFKYYTFSLGQADRDSQVCITFEPKKQNKKLLSGDILLADHCSRIERIRMKGTTSFSTFDMTFFFTNPVRNRFLPNKVMLYMEHDVMGNKVTQNLEAALDYQKVVPSSEIKIKKVNLGRINYLEFSADSIHLVNDSSYWYRKRLIGNERERRYVQEVQPYATNITPDREEEDAKDYLHLTKRIISPKNWKSDNTKIHYGGIISPSIVGYSGVNGFRYRQQLKMSHVFKSGRMLLLQPEIEYQSKHGKLLYRLSGGYEYAPELLGMVSMNIVKDNDIYPFPDPLDKEATLGFKYNYYEISNRIEIANGLVLKNILRYKEWKKRGYKACDLLPEFRIFYTPKQYYWMNGRYKEYLYSPLPTLGLTVAYAIPGLRELSSHYWQVETEISQRIRAGLSRSISYYIGMGKKWNKGGYYRPADFRAFNVRYPSGVWQDRYGAVFNNLDHDFYYVPRQYIQCQVRLEGELLLLSKMDLSFQKYIFSEHLIWSHLYTKEKPYYSELGYGLTNDLIGLTFMLGFDKYKYDSFGLKFRINFIGK